MNEISKKEFDALKKELEGLKKSHHELLETLMKLTDGLRGLVETHRGAKRYGEETVSARLKNYYEIFNKTYLKISSLKFGH